MFTVKILKYILPSLLLLLLPSAVLSSDLEITCFADKPPSVVKNRDPLFNITNILPGNSVSRTVSFRNTDSESDCRVFFEVSGKTNIFSDRLRVDIPNLFDGTLSEYMSGKRILMANLQPNQELIRTITISFPSTAGNTYQKRETSFDIFILSEWGLEEVPTGLGPEVLGVATQTGALPRTGQGVLLGVIFSVGTLLSFFAYRALSKKTKI
jgi:hypothetical protein